MKLLHLVTHRSSFFERRIRGLRERGHSCSVVPVPSPDHDDRAKRQASRRSLRHYLRFYGRVLASIDEPHDIVHAHYGLTAPFAVLQPRRPLVLSLWGSDLFGEFGWLSERCAGMVGETIVMSPEMAAALGSEATVVPHGVDTDRFRPMDRGSASRAVGWDRDVRHVLFPYAPSRSVKNFPLAERVVDRARGRVDGEVRLHAVSEADRDSVPRYMNAADAMLLTSRREGSPNTVKEALACNLPVVATDVGDVRQRLEGVTPSRVCPGEAALVDALASVLASGERSNGRPVAESLSVDRMTNRLEAVYRRAIR